MPNQPTEVRVQEAQREEARQQAHGGLKEKWAMSLAVSTSTETLPVLKSLAPNLKNTPSTDFRTIDMPEMCL